MNVGIGGCSVWGKKDVGDDSRVGVQSMFRGESRGDPHGAKEPPVWLDLLLRSTDGGLLGTSFPG